MNQYLDTRENAEIALRREIYIWLTGPGGLLRRYEVPGHLADEDAKSEIRAMTMDVAETLGLNLRREDRAAVLELTAKNLRREWGARQWPSIKALLKAVRDASAEFVRDQIKAGTFDPTLEMAVEYAMRTGRPSFIRNDPEVTLALIQRGFLQDEREARVRGFEYVASREVIEAMPKSEWERRHLG